MDTWTFLFTDIEDSTVLFERAGAVYTGALNRHLELLRAAIVRHGGEEFRNTGDGLLGAFKNSPSALACAQECQRELSAVPWPPEIHAFRVRIGLHRGEAVRDMWDFQGLTMHHATRVLNAANGGQIICSGAVFEDLDPGTQSELCDLGLFRLRGVAIPVRLYQVSYEGMPAEFPPVRSPAAFTHRLPAPATPFFGREGELQELAALLAPELEAKTRRRYGRLVTLHGPGGTGKTRLSLAVAERLLPAYSQAVWFVPLAELRAGDLLPEVLREALGVPPEPAAPAIKSVSEFLAAQPSLVVLDNFEQIVPSGVETVRTLLERVPGLVILTSSRVRLGLRAEQEFNVTPLLLPPEIGPVEELVRYPSVQLYVDRARATRRAFELTDENAADVARICRVLEGIPLAIELAAARASILTPRQTLSRLGHPLDFLVSRSQDFACRHRTLRATVAWSFELLSERLQRMIARLSIFRSGWSLPAAEAAAADDPKTLLEELVELESCSLIVSEENDHEMRYRMLEVIREYAQERLRESGEEAELAARYHRYFCALARHLAQEAGEAERFRQIEAEGDNLRAVLAGAGPIAERAQLAVDLRDYWMVRGWFVEGRRWCQGLLTQELEPSFRASVANAAGILAWNAGELAEARENMEEAMRIWLPAGGEEKVAAMLNNFGMVAGDQGNLEAAREFYERSLAIYRRLGPRSPLAKVLSNLGENAVFTKCLGEARAALEESLALQEELGEQLASANTLHNFAELHRELGEGATARRYLARSVQIRLALASRENLPATWTTLARIALVEGDHRRAAALFGAAEAAFRQLEMRPSPAHRAQCERDLAAVLAALGDEEFTRMWTAGRHWTLEQTLTSDGDWMNPLDRPTASPANSAA